jgi:hypothetical protein
VLSAGNPTTFSGSLPNASPASKSRRKKQKTFKTGAGAVGQRPNISYLAMPLADLRKEHTYHPMTTMCNMSLTAETVMALPAEERQQLMLDCLPQRTDLWCNLRSMYGVTGSSLATMLGLNEQCSVQLFDANSCFVDHLKAEQLFLHLNNGTAPPCTSVSVAMDWGTLHEANCKITVLRAMCDMTMREVGLAELHVAGLQASVVEGVDCTSLPRMGASPDGLGVLGVQSCQLLAKNLGRTVAPNTQVLFEAKCKSAFVPGPVIGNGDDTYRFLGAKAKAPRVVLPHWFAQVQLGMLSADVRLAVLAVYHTGTTMVVCIPRDDVWCNLMLKSVQWFMHTYVGSGTVPPVDFCLSMPGHAAFMALTRDNCRAAVSKVWILPSVNNTTQQVVWMDDGASDRLLPAL